MLGIPRQTEFQNDGENKRLSKRETELKGQNTTSKEFSKCQWVQALQEKGKSKCQTLEKPPNSLKRGDTKRNTTSKDT